MLKLIKVLIAALLVGPSIASPVPSPALVKRPSEWGQVNDVSPDGTRLTANPDGTRVTRDAALVKRPTDWGQVNNVSPDGTRVTAKPDGTRVTRDAPAVKEYATAEPDGIRVNGVADDTDPDGTRVTRNVPAVKEYSTQPDGTRVTRDGIVVNYGVGSGDEATRVTRRENTRPDTREGTVGASREFDIFTDGNPWHG